MSYLFELLKIDLRDMLYVHCTYCTISCIVHRDDAHSHADECAEGKRRLGHRAALERKKLGRVDFHKIKYKFVAQYVCTVCMHA